MDVIAAIAERRIAEGREAGMFDDLPGAGEPIADLHVERPAGWWAMRYLRDELSGERDSSSTVNP